MPRKSRKKPRLHFAFGPHFGNAPYVPSYLGQKPTDYLVVEYAEGSTPKPISVRTLRKGVADFGDKGTHLEEARKYKVRFAQLGGKVYPGESGTKEELKRLTNKRNIATGYAFQRGTGQNYFDFELFVRKLVSDANYFLERHKLIGNRIAALEKSGTVLARYGSLHSTLSREMQKRGIESNRDISPMVFTHELSLVRKILMGKKPADIPIIEYKQAFVSELLLNWFNPIKVVKNDGSEHLTNFIVVRTLVDGLSERDLNEIIVQQNLALALSRNGIDIHHLPTRKGWLKFLEKHSVFYRRMKEIEKMKKK